MADHPAPDFIDSPALRGREGHYTDITVDTGLVLKSWRESLFSFEWLQPDGRFKSPGDLPPVEQQKRERVERLLELGEKMEKPVLGIGMLDNVEIGAGRAVFLTLAAHGVKALSVHVPKSHREDFTPFLAKDPAPATRTRQPESGNVLYYILLAIVLLAALTIAVANSSRTTSGNITSDRQRLLASELIDYGDSVSKAAMQMRLRGMTFSQIRFAAAGLSATYGTYNTTPAYEIFNPEGGAIHYKAPPAEAMNSAADYIFTAGNEIQDVGTTCGAASCTDLIMIAGPIKTSVCIQINDLMGLNAMLNAAPPTVASVDTATLFAGTPTYTATLGNTVASAPLKGKSSGCFTNGGTNYYYQVVLPQ